MLLTLNVILNDYITYYMKIKQYYIYGLYCCYFSNSFYNIIVKYCNIKRQNVTDLNTVSSDGGESFWVLMPLFNHSPLTAGSDFMR